MFRLSDENNSVDKDGTREEEDNQDRDDSDEFDSEFRLNQFHISLKAQSVI